MKIRSALMGLVIIMASTLTAQIIEVPNDQPTIQEGIQAANPGDTVLVAEGTYYENIRFQGKAITVGSHYLTTGDESFIDNTIIDGSTASDPDSASTVMFIGGEDTTSILRGFTIQGGGGTLISTWGYLSGGGVFCYASGAKILNNKITDNTMSHDIHNVGGAGIGTCAESSDPWVVIRNNHISYNSTYANSYSAFAGGIHMTLNSIMENNVIEYNYCYNSGDQSDGGGIEVEQITGTNIIVTIKNNLIQHNTLEGELCLGAGLVFWGVYEVNLLYNTIQNNQCNADSTAKGGAIFCHGSNKVYVTNNDITNNVCNGYRAYSGGMLMRGSTANSLIADNVFSGNLCDATYGSAGSALRVIFPMAKTMLSNNTFSHNVATGSEFSYGAVFLWDAMDYEVIVDRNLFYKNEAQFSAAFYTRNSNHLYLSNNFFLRNTASSNGGAIMLYEYYNKGNSDFPAELSGDPITKLKTPLSHACFVNNTFINNQANIGGAIISDVSINYPIFLNSLFFNNSAMIGADIYTFSNSSLELSYSNFDPDNVYGGYSGEGNINCVPFLEDDSLHLTEYSHCINGGTDSLMIDETWYLSPGWDYDGELRPYENTMPDIGADESLFLHFITGVDPPAPIQKKVLKVSPNPVSESLTVMYSIQEPGDSRLVLLNSQGKEVEVIGDQKHSTGEYQVTISLTHLPAGIYFVLLRSGHSSERVKIIKK